MRLSPFAMLFAATLAAAAAPGTGPAIDVTACGAKGDGSTMDTAAIQSAIDRCAGSGGGTVRLPPGRYLTGSIHLRSGVLFRIESGAVLVGSTSMTDYARGPLIGAEDARDITIEGGGQIDARGEAFWEYGGPYAGPPWRGTAQFEYRALKRPRCVHFLRCENVALRDITIRNSPSWTIHLQRCAGARIERVTIRNPLHGPNTDGIDINSCNGVLVDSCDIVTGDDGVVLKSTEPGRDHPSRDITVSGCRIWSACNALKIGTETHSDFENITFRGCALHCGSTNPLERALSGVAIESVDGANLRGIRVEDITMSNLRAPLFVRLGHRGGNSPKTRQVEPRVPGSIRDVVIRRVRAERMMFESSITGIPGHPVDGVTLEDITVAYEGGGGPDLVDADVPDEGVIARYPEAQMFGRLPAYGLYARHVRNLALTRVRFSLLAPDTRSAVMLDDAANFRLERIDAAPSSSGQPLLCAARSRDGLIRECTAPPGAPVLLRILGDPAALQSMRLEGNRIPDGTKEVELLSPQDELAALPLFGETAPGTIAIDARRMALRPPMRKDAAGIAAPTSAGRDQGNARARFEIGEPGRYAIKVLALAPSGEANSFHLAVDEAAPWLVDIPVGTEPAWVPVRDRGAGRPDSPAVATFALNSGIHLLTIRSREPGTRIDAIAIRRVEQTR